MQAKKARLWTYKQVIAHTNPIQRKKSQQAFETSFVCARSVASLWSGGDRVHEAASSGSSFWERGGLTRSLWMLFLALQNKALAFLSLRPWSYACMVRFQFYERSMLISFHKRGVFNLKPWHKSVSPLFSQCGPFTTMEKSLLRSR